MVKYRNIRSIDTIYLVLFEPGMGGQFISNLFNISDPGFIKEDLKDIYRESMFSPIGSAYIDEEMSTNFHSGKWFFNFINSRSSDDDLDLWLTDIEITTISTSKTHGVEINNRYHLEDKPITRHSRIYLPYHVPDDPNTDVALEHVSRYASRFGVRLRFILVTTEDDAVRHWAYQRSHDMGIVPLESYQDYVDRYQGTYLSALRHPDTVELRLDGFVNGSVSSLLNQITAIIGENIENVDTIRSRAESYLENKIRNRDKVAETIVDHNDVKVVEEPDTVPVLIDKMRYIMDVDFHGNTAYGTSLESYGYNRLRCMLDLCI